MQLSPFNFRGLIVNMHGLAAADPEPKGNKQHRSAIQCWRCPECLDVHDWEDEAEECCAEEETAATVGATACPVCAAKFDSARQASDCCLWKDVDAHTRWGMADAVEAGSTWAEQLQVTA